MAQLGTCCLTLLQQSASHFGIGVHRTLSVLDRRECTLLLHTAYICTSTGSLHTAK